MEEDINHQHLERSAYTDDTCNIIEIITKILFINVKLLQLLSYTFQLNHQFLLSNLSTNKENENETFRITMREGLQRFQTGQSMKKEQIIYFKTFKQVYKHIVTIDCSNK